MPDNAYCNLVGTNNIKDEFAKITTGFGLVDTDVIALMADNAQQYINVKSAPYNAAGDGVTDDTAAFTSALAALVRGVLFVPEGVYCVDFATAFALKQGQTLRGVNSYASILKNTGSHDIITISKSTRTMPVSGQSRLNEENIVIEDMGFYGGTGRAIVANNTGELRIRRCFFLDIENTAVYINDSITFDMSASVFFQSGKASVVGTGTLTAQVGFDSNYLQPVTVADSSIYTVGDIIKIVGAGKNAIDLLTNVESITDGTTINLTIPAHTSVTDADIIKINPVIRGTTTSSTNTTLRLDNLYISNCCLIDDVGQGVGIDIVNTGSCQLSHVACESSGVPYRFAGNKGNVTNLHMVHCYTENTNPCSASFGSRAYNASTVKIDNCAFTDSSGSTKYHLIFENSGGTSVTDCSFGTSTYESIYLRASAERPEFKTNNCTGLSIAYEYASAVTAFPISWLGVADSANTGLYAQEDTVTTASVATSTILNHLITLPKSFPNIHQRIFVNVRANGGTEMITAANDQNFDTDIGNWTYASDTGNGTLVHQSSAIGGHDKSAKMTVGSTAGTLNIARLAAAKFGSLTAGKLYRVRFDVYIPAASTPSAIHSYILNQSLSVGEADVETKDEWQTVDVDFVYTTGFADLDLRVEGGDVGDIYYFDNISVIELIEDHVVLGAHVFDENTAIVRILNGSTAASTFDIDYMSIGY